MISSWLLIVTPSYMDGTRNTTIQKEQIESQSHDLELRQPLSIW